HSRIGRSGLAKQLDRRPELLLAETGFESHAVDVEDHGLLLFFCDGEAGRSQRDSPRLRLTSSTRLPSGLRGTSAALLWRRYHDYRTQSRKFRRVSLSDTIQWIRPSTVPTAMTLRATPRWAEDFGLHGVRATWPKNQAPRGAFWREIVRAEIARILA